MRAQDHPPPEVDIYTDNGEQDSTQKFSKKIKHNNSMVWTLPENNSHHGAYF